jgi:hypothetical protein
MSITFSTRDESLGYINMSNGNAWLVMQAAGIEPDHCGTITAAQIPAVLRSIMARLNGSVSAFTRAPVDECATRMGRSAHGNVVCIERGPRIIDPGIDDEYVRTRLGQLQELLLAAKRANLDMSWG